MEEDELLGRETSSEVSALESDRMPRGNRRKRCPVDLPAYGSGGAEVRVLDLNLNLNLDLNAGFDLNLNEIDLNDGGDAAGEGGGVGSGRECIDLNLDLNGVVEVEVEEEEEEAGLGAGLRGEVRKRECDFDLNLEVNEEIVKEEQVDGVGANVELVDVHVHVHDGTYGDFSLESKDGLGSGCLVVEVLDDGSHGIQVERRGRGRPRGSRKRFNDLVSAPEMVVCGEGSQVDLTVVESASREGSGRRKGRKRLLEDLSSDVVLIGERAVGDALNDEAVDESEAQNGSMYTEMSGDLRKRRKIRGPHDPLYTPETMVLRHSTRRGSVGSSVSPAVSALTEENFERSCLQQPEEPSVLPQKVLLPPCSKNPDLSGLPILNVFSIYAFLRSFSMLLFLSPFDFEDFVEALKSDSANSLFDCIHVAILQILKKHLEYLSSEGSESASDCLRSLDWNFLDQITWPIFMVEYYVIHGSGLKHKFDLSFLKLFRNNYHKQPVSVKVEMLRCLCDDVIEVEAIRSELNRRSSGAEFEPDFDRYGTLGSYKKKRPEMDLSGVSCLTEEAAEDTGDWNSDECCLCKMDGQLICCDGCPAAFHSKCVGVAEELLPDGDWYCPECSIGRHKPWVKTRNSLRGAELLGIDPYGQLYFSSCGYLLVSDSCDIDNSFRYYNRDDLHEVIKVLKSSVSHYQKILEAICKHWVIPVSLSGDNSDFSSLMCTMHAELVSSETYTITNRILDQRNLEDKFVTGCSHQHDANGLKAVSSTCLSSEGSAEMTHISARNQDLLKEGPSCSTRSAYISKHSKLPRSYPVQGDISLTFMGSDVREEKNIKPLVSAWRSSAVNIMTVELEKVPPGTDYVNYYTFGHIAASIAEALMRKPTDNNVGKPMKSEEEIISAEMMVISKRLSGVSRSNLLNLPADVLKENCGWCFSCRADSGDSECLFNLRMGPIDRGPLQLVADNHSNCDNNGYLEDVMCSIFLLEYRLQGLLLGPWSGTCYSSRWRENVQQASDLKSAKNLLLTLELNLPSRTLSADWFKNMDSALTMGSASHIVINSSRASSRNIVGRKRIRCSEMELKPSPNPNGGLSMFWWRGGRISRHLFCWKVLPHSLVSKAARKGGCQKILGVVYPDNADPAKRIKYAAWRAAVESSVTVEQLALQVRDLDSNIKWDEIENIRAMSILDKEFKKSIRHFKKAIIRRKCKDGEGTKYLLDFGKRKIIPEIVTKNGTLVKESSSERRKYWLDESHVPLHLMKTFEEKRISRISRKHSGKLLKANEVARKPLEERGFAYLFAKAERSEFYQCGHCSQDVAMREAICCHYCKGTFHKRHVRRSGGSVTAECIYTCYQCADGKYLAVNSKKRQINLKEGETVRNKGTSQTKNGTTNSKRAAILSQKSKKVTAVRKSERLRNIKTLTRVRSQLQNKRKIAKTKVNVVVPLRRSSRKAKNNLLEKQSRKFEVSKKKQVKKSKAKCEQPKKGILLRKKRSVAYHSYWLNGLRLSRKPCDERVEHFRLKGFVGPFESVITEQPKCHLCCESEYTSSSTYISCEICGEWFHGEAFGLALMNMNKLIGFRCHVCCKRASPVCHSASVLRSHERVLEQPEFDSEIRVSERAINQFRGTDCLPETVSNENHQGSLPCDGPIHEEGQLGSTLNTVETFDSNHKLEKDNEHMLVDVSDGMEEPHCSRHALEPDIRTLRGVNNAIEEITAPDDGSVVTSCDGLQSSSCKIDVDVVGSGPEALGQSGAKKGTTTPT